jgi:magnesium-transporting ATPase (P-type)
VEFFRAICICHTAIPQHRKESMFRLYNIKIYIIDILSELIYESSSPDEMALLNGARELGFILLVDVFDQVFI